MKDLVKDFFKDGRHSSQFVSRQESFHIKGRRQSCRYKHLLTTSLKVHSLYQSLPYWSCWCLHKEDPPVLTLLLPFSEYNSLHTPSLAVCWQNPLRHLWAFCLEKGVMAGPCRLIPLGQGLLKRGWQKPSFTFSWGSSEGNPHLTNVYLAPQRNRLPKSRTLQLLACLPSWAYP